MRPHDWVIIRCMLDIRTASQKCIYKAILLESGELYVWGYGKAIGYRYKDIVSPIKKLSHYTNIIQLAGGAAHSLALTGQY